MDAEVFAREVGRLVRERRLALGMTQKTLALMMDVSRRFIVDLELGKAPGVRMSTLLRVLEALGISISLSVEGGDQCAERFEVDLLSSESEKCAEDDKERYANAFERVVGTLGRPVE